MSNEFSKEERVAFEDIAQGFQDAEVMARNVRVYNTEQSMMERANNTLWIPRPYIMQSFDGTDQTGNFGPVTQTSVPVSLTYKKSAPWEMSMTDLRDAMQEGRLGKSAQQKLASDINVACLNVASNLGSIFVKRTAAATGFDDIATADARMNELGVPQEDRVMALSSSDYNNMAGNLAGRQTMTGKPVTAYEKAYVGPVSGFDTYKLDYANRKAAAAGGGSLTIDTRSSASNYYTPVATRAASSGEQSNVDNRFQTITISSTTSVAAGDAFTIDGVVACHMITKGATSQNKTFRVVSVPSSTTLVITPPIISNQGGTDAEAQYQNCSVTASATAAITFLNTAVGYLNPFWQKDAIMLLPGRYVVPAGAGASVMTATTDSGVQLMMTKQWDINTGTTKFRIDTFFGVANLDPEQSGVMMFSQS